MPDVTRRMLSRWPTAAVGVALVCLASAAPGAQPRVPYVPTPQEVVERMLEMAKVSSSDYLIDLGSGDGRIVVTAARKYGTRGFGVDINPERIDEANENARKAGVTDRVAFYQRDLFQTDLSDASVITMYLLPRVNLELRPRLLDLRPGTRLVSHDFSMDDWKPDAFVDMEAKDKYGGSGGRSEIYLWIVPARVGGVWRWELAVRGRKHVYEVRFDQQYQVVSGQATIDGRITKLQSARLRGDELSFSYTAQLDGRAVKHAYAGRVAGDVITGNVTLSGDTLQSRLEWAARRAAPASAQVGVPVVASAKPH